MKVYESDLKTDNAVIGSYFVNKKTNIMITSEAVVVSYKSLFRVKRLTIAKDTITNYFYDEAKDKKENVTTSNKGRFKTHHYVIRYGIGHKLRLNFEGHDLKTDNINSEFSKEVVCQNIQSFQQALDLLLGRGSN